MLGSQLAPIALAFAVLDLSDSAVALGLVLAARTVPNIVLLPIGGVWADRVSRRRVMAISNLVQFAAQSATAALLVTGVAHVWHLAVLQAVSGAAVAFFNPAATGLTPETVSPARLQAANALLSLTRSSAGVAGPALAGVLVATVGAGWAIAVDALTFAVSAALLAKLELPSRMRLARRAMATDLKDGWRELRERTWVWVSILGFMSFQFAFLSTFFVLGPIIAKETLGGVSAWALITAGYGVGAIVGDVAAMRLAPSRPLVAGKLVMLLTVPALVLLADSDSKLAIAAATALAGAALTFHDTLWFTTLQENVPAHAVSRVSSYDSLGSTLLRPLGYAAVGPIAALLGVEHTLFAAALVVAGAHVAMLAVPSIRAVSRTLR